MNKFCVVSRASCPALATESIMVATRGLGPAGELRMSLAHMLATGPACQPASTSTHVKQSRDRSSRVCLLLQVLQMTVGGALTATAGLACLAAGGIVQAVERGWL